MATLTSASGMTLAAEQNYQAAIEEYKAAAQLEPDLQSVFYRLGVAQAKQKNYDAAIAAFYTQQQEAGDDFDTEKCTRRSLPRKGHGPRSRRRKPMRKGRNGACNTRPKLTSLPELQFLASNPGSTRWR